MHEKLCNVSQSDMVSLINNLSYLIAAYMKLKICSSDPELAMILFINARTLAHMRIYAVTY